MRPVHFETLHGSAAQAYGPDLARLRIQVFREFPYLYEGTEGYETRYLQTYMQCADSFILLAKDNDQVIGATTAIPLKFEEDAFQKPFREHHFLPETVMYFGESVLLPNYRGLGIGKTFLQKRLDYARHYPGIRWAAFCAVQRAPNDPRRPMGYRSLDSLWQSFGFQAQAGMHTHYHWQEIGQTKETDQMMQFWLRAIP